MILEKLAVRDPGRPRGSNSRKRNAPKTNGLFTKSLLGVVGGCGGTAKPQPFNPPEPEVYESEAWLYKREGEGKTPTGPSPTASHKGHSPQSQEPFAGSTFL